MNPFTLHADDRLLAWKKLRHDISELDTLQQLNEVIKFWEQCPLGPRAIDPYTPKNWPTVWEILHHGLFCEDSRIIGIAQTLFLLSAEFNDTNIMVVDHPERGAILTLHATDELYGYDYDAMVHPLQVDKILDICYFSEYGWVGC